MLKIERHSCKIVNQPFSSSRNNNNHIDVTPLPKLPYPQHKLNPRMWQTQHFETIEQIWDDMIDMLSKMEVSDKYVCKYNMTAIKNEFVKILYESSRNTDRSFR